MKMTAGDERQLLAPYLLTLDTSLVGLSASEKMGLWNEWRWGCPCSWAKGAGGSRRKDGGQPGGGGRGTECWSPQAQAAFQVRDIVSALTAPGQPPTWIPSRTRAQIPRQVFAKPGRGGGEGAPFPSPLASDAFGWAHLISLTVFMFSSLTLAVWSTSLRKYLLLKVVAITTTSLHARPSISEMQNLPLKACAAHQRGIGAHYFYIILQANRYFPIHISFLS